MSPRPVWWIAPLILALLVAACGGGDGGDSLLAVDGQATTTTTTTTTTPPSTTAPEPIESKLTGLPIEDAAVRNRPVVVVKIDNAPKAQPQIGVNQADIVYELQVEGHITRLMALFQSNDAVPVGPVRSTRASEIPLLEELNGPLFTWHGANEVMGAQVRASAIHPRSISDIPQLFYRDRSRPGPHNSFVQGTDQIRATAPEGAHGPTTPILTFATGDEAASPTAQPANQVVVNFASGTRQSSTSFTWDPPTNKWLREQNGGPHLDVNREQVGVQNVIVRFTPSVNEGFDSAGNPVPTAQIVGEGEAWVFTKQSVIVGTWRKPDNMTPTQYLDSAGNPVKLTPGRTWISVPYAHNGSHYG